MATLYSTETAGLDSLPVVKAAAPSYGGSVKVFQSTITLATQTTSDAIVLADVPAGYKFLYGVITTTASLGSAAVAIGTNATHGSNGQYRASAVFTATDTPTLFGVAATGPAAATLTATTRIYLTCTTANLPASGTLAVQLFYALDN